MSSHSRSDGDRNSSSSEKRDRDNFGGTLDVARGPSGTDSRDKLRSLKRDKISKMSPDEKDRMRSYLYGANDHANKKRREALRHDDRNESTSNLTPAQKRALDRRRRGGKPNKILRAKMDRAEARRMENAIAAGDAELILNTEVSGLVEAENDMERTTALTQAELKRSHLDEQTARHIFDLKLDHYGPYGMSYDRSGRCGVLHGNRGHIALMDCHTLGLKTEFHLNETVRDATFLHNTTMFALAQKNHAFIYDDAGVEIHRMSDHNDPFRLQFLPYHWLLVTVGRAGWLKYHDTSTGRLVSQHRTKLGACSVMRQNPSNAVIHLGHSNGTVTLWSPASRDYLVKMLCHKGAPVHCLAVDHSGRYMVTGGADSQVRIWDLRMYRETHAYYTTGGPPRTMDISQQGILGIGHGMQNTFWSSDALKMKVKDPYMRHDVPGCGPVESLRFRPYEDVCGVGHRKGFSSIVIPGSGEPNLDTMEYNTNPYQDAKQRREAEVRSLLDKLQPDMIALDPDVVATVEESDPFRRLERVKDLEEEANARKDALPKKKEKKKMRGRGKIQKKLKRKQKNVVDANVMKLREAKEQEHSADQKWEHEGVGIDAGATSQRDSAPSALKRFF